MNTIESIFYLYYFSVLGHPFADAVHSMKMCQAFQKEGYTTTLFCPKSRHESFEPEKIWQRYGIDKPFKITAYPALPGLRKHDVALRSALEAKRAPATLAYTRNPAAAMWSTLLGVPTIVDAHSPAGTRLGQYYLHIAFRQPSFKRLIVITKPLKDLYLKKYPNVLKPSQILVLPNGVDVESFDQLPDKITLRMELGLPENKFIVGYSGSLYAGRGIELILELALRLKAMQFLILGGIPSDIARWKSTTKELTITNVSFLGFIPNILLPKFIKACDALLMPYQPEVRVYGDVGNTSTFMSPMKMFEYMAAERLIISSDFPVIREILNDQNAVLCPPEDVSEWQSALQRAMNNPNWATKLAQKAKLDVRQYTWQKRARLSVTF